MINQQIRARVEAIGFEGALIDTVAQRLTELAEDTIASEVTRYLTSAEQRVQSADGDYTSYYRPVLSMAFGEPTDGNSWILADGTASRWVTYHTHTGYADLFPQEGVPEFAFPDAAEPVVFPLDADAEQAESDDAALADPIQPMGLIDCTCHTCESARLGR